MSDLRCTHGTYSNHLHWRQAYMSANSPYVLHAQFMHAAMHSHPGQPPHVPQMTDVQKQLKQMPAEATSSERLKLLAKLSFARTLGAAWLIPVMDLFVRCKLNVIGGWGLAPTLCHLRPFMCQYMSQHAWSHVQAHSFWEACLHARPSCSAVHTAQGGFS